MIEPSRVVKSVDSGDGIDFTGCPDDGRQFLGALWGMSDQRGERLLKADAHQISQIRDPAEKKMENPAGVRALLR